MGIKVCPHCGSSMFAAKIVIPGVVRSEENGTFNIFKESKDKQDIEIVMCARCRHELTNESLVEGIVCKECGRVVSPSDVDDNGVCDVCNAKKQRADLANASQEDLIKMIINMEKASKGLPTLNNEIKVQEDKVADESDASDEVENQEEGADKKPRKRRAKRSVSTEEETQESDIDAEETEIVTDIAEATDSISVAVDNLANQQDAPFPDAIAEDITGVTTDTVSDTNTEDVSGVNNFAMYESDEAF